MLITSNEKLVLYPCWSKSTKPVIPRNAICANWNKFSLKPTERNLLVACNWSTNFRTTTDFHCDTRSVGYHPQIDFGQDLAELLRANGFHRKLVPIQSRTKLIQNWKGNSKLGQLTRTLCGFFTSGMFILLVILVQLAMMPINSGLDSSTMRSEVILVRPNLKSSKSMVCKSNDVIR